MDLKRNDDEHVGEEKKKAFYQRQPHRRRNRIGMKMDSGIRNGVKYSKGHPGFWSITQPPTSHPSFFWGCHSQVFCPFSGVSRINALNNYTHIPGKSVLLGKSKASDETPQGYAGLERRHTNAELRARRKS